MNWLLLWNSTLIFYLVFLVESLKSELKEMKKDAQINSCGIKHILKHLK